jgi:uncharacterized membrane protein
MRVMSFLNRLLLATFVGVVLAAGVHIAAILTAPRYAEQDAFGRIQPTLAAEHAQIISAPGGANTWLPMPDPAAAVAACAFNLSDGPARIAAKTGALFLSFSFHTKTGGVFFAVTDRAAVRGELEIVVMTARQLDEARAGEDVNEPSRDVRIVAPESRGFMIVRVVAPTSSLHAQAQQAAEAVSCTVDEQV